MSIVWEDPLPSVGDRDFVCWGDEEAPLEVAPLAMAAPCVEEFKSVRVLKDGIA